MPASKAQQAETAARRAQLIRLRRTGVPFDDERVLALGYASPGAASKDLIRALQERRDEQDAEASVYRQQENERLDALLEAVWEKATKPSPVHDKDGQYLGDEIDLKAVDTVLKLMDRRAKLMGLDMPVKAELSGPGGGALRLNAVSLAELNTLIATAGDPDDPDRPCPDDEDDDTTYDPFDDEADDDD
ncbi:hypothetical protein [Streptomyces sp. DH12]|uniref:hypothetical protein n=1 Tax=Streptomyces sp. DH12 TaxID=2857010 RepID=UPI001E5D330F|nr:hypothetical protein [Streptomyces sp. DH12]